MAVRAPVCDIVYATAILASSGIGDEGVGWAYLVLIDWYITLCVDSRKELQEHVTPNTMIAKSIFNVFIFFWILKRRVTISLRLSLP
ncbi:MAG: hypothetical protein KHX42_11905 [Prevotella sp.]|nr:hypothetical protein [Prevotella sp.]